MVWLSLLFSKNNVRATRGPEKSKENGKPKNMKNKKTIGLIAGFVVLAVISFYAGNMYANAKNKTGTSQNINGFMRGAGGAQRGLRVGGGNVLGQIIAKDATSITIQLNTPTVPNTTSATTTATGSKIVLYTTSTTVSKTATGTMADLAVGTNVSVQGTANPDGSVSAQSISIRSANIRSN